MSAKKSKESDQSVDLGVLVEVLIDTKRTKSHSGEGSYSFRTTIFAKLPFCKRDIVKIAMKEFNERYNNLKGNDTQHPSNDSFFVEKITKIGSVKYGVWNYKTPSCEWSSLWWNN